MRFGVHVRTAGGLVESLDRAENLGCEAAQLFSANPNGWATHDIDPTKAAAFRDRIDALGIHPVTLHTPYLLNLASPDEDIWHKSVASLSDAMRKAEALKADYVVTHIGSHKGEGYEGGVVRIGDAVRAALRAGHHATIALELGSGSGRSIGSTFEEIADIFACLEDCDRRVGVCIDTAHLYGSGYDISTATGVNHVFATLDRMIGGARLKVVHLNDTQMELGSKRDRHYHIGKGNIGMEGFRAVVNHPLTRSLPGIIETPADDIEQDRANLDTLRSLREARTTEHA